MEKGDLARACDDFSAAVRLDPTCQTARVKLVSALLLRGDCKAALVAADATVTAAPADLDAMRVRAAALTAGQRCDEACTQWAVILRRQSPPIAQDVMDFAAACSACHPPRLEEAVLQLEPALRRQPHHARLRDNLIALYARCGQFDRAVAVVDETLGTMPRKEWWLDRRSALLEQAGRSAEAGLCCRQALQVIAALPDQQRLTRAVSDLTAQVHARLLRLAPARKISSPPSVSQPEPAPMPSTP